jgi:hypothetical protein
MEAKLIAYKYEKNVSACILLMKLKDFIENEIETKLIQANILI